MTAAALASTWDALSPTESILLGAAGSTLGRRLSAEDVSVPLSMLGADSLRLIELAVAVEDAVAVTLPPDAAHESVTIRELAAGIELRRRAAGDDPVPVDPFAQMLADSVLPEDIRPHCEGIEPTASCRAHAGPLRGLQHSRAVLLTGATGFLGGQLAADLLARTKARLLCLVRGSREGAADRLSRRLIANGVSPRTLATRVVAVEGDLARPRLGLMDDEWQRLACNVDQVLHAGASVNWAATYASLRAANVSGTLELLRLACATAPMPFHFVSSLSVCYAVDGPRQVDETFDPLPHLRGVTLGYAQSKIIAESLVRAAGERGLPITIHRPSLISGHSRSGAFNPDDLLARLVAGCVRMGTAPDLDWRLDCEPVDVVSAGILALSSGSGTTHLRHSRPRHWRECLVWMRLTGYAIRLVPYQAWLAQLDRETAAQADHPLRPLRTFFLTRTAAAHGLTLPELYEEDRRSTAIAIRTDARLAGSCDRPALDAALLERYFDAYRADGYLPAPTVSPRNAGPCKTMVFDAAFFESAFSSRGRTVVVRAARQLSAGSDHGIISELTTWRSRQPAGLFHYELDLDTPRGPQTTPVVLKLKPHADEATAVGDAVASLCDARVGRAYGQWKERLGLAGSHLRERAIYEWPDDRFRRHLPALLGAAGLDPRGGCALVLEDIGGARLLDSTEHQPWWQPADIATALDGLAELHSATYGSTSALDELPWLGFQPCAAATIEMSDLWTALADHAATPFARWGGDDLPARHQALVASIADWAAVLDEGPRALIHNDFNPRNLCIRDNTGDAVLCAYDWELATLGLPQRDLAELLTFVLPPTTTDQIICGWVEHHRRALARATGLAIDSRQWRRGFAAALNELLINRLAMYALINRVRQQAFLPRLLASWRRLHECARRMAA